MDFWEKKELIDKERKRLTRQFAQIDKKKKAIVQGLIEKAAYLKVEMEIMEEDLSVNGWTEMFSQSEKTEPYERQRPMASTYLSACGQYSKMISTLNSLIPKDTGKSETVDDGFDDFLKKR